MAVSRVLIASLVLSLLLLHVVSAVEQANSNQVASIDCNSACKGRCRLASRKRRCMRECMSCCNRCKCVPPGTSGNEEVCPCYAHMTTHNGKKHKCP
ncbi:snakin-2-like [Telopea speciosissima]|uniref:snakin-2-like n=1 Tax=Telopea speciosissima TaxID=54955 RepID=UPI001CC79A3C|nr:snakin-2-like [Telopea speciosissima]